MSPFEHLTRRSLLSRLGAIAAAVSLPTAAAASGIDGIRSLCRQAASDPDLVEAGRVCLAELGGHRRPDDLRSALATKIVGSDPVAALDDAVRRDFAAGRIVSVEGWQISETEAEFLAALRLGVGV